MSHKPEQHKVCPSCAQQSTQSTYVAFSLYSRCFSIMCRNDLFVLVCVLLSFVVCLICTRRNAPSSRGHAVAMRGERAVMPGCKQASISALLERDKWNIIKFTLCSVLHGQRIVSRFLIALTQNLKVRRETWCNFEVGSVGRDKQLLFLLLLVFVGHLW